MQKKNILVLHADQLRFDGLSLNGAPEGLTPNIDSIAGEGYNLVRHLATNPVCMPSRASFFTGLHTTAHGVWGNGVPLNRSCYNPPATASTSKHCGPNYNPCLEVPTMADVFKKNDYRTASFGKLHFTPVVAHPDFGFEESYEMWKIGALDGWTGPYYGFDHVEFALGHGELPVTEGGHYANWLQQVAPQLFADIIAGKTYHKPFQKDDLYLSLIPSELHNSTWLGQRFCDYLDRIEDDNPFFCCVGFPDPHHPFTPPFDSLSAVADMDLPPIGDPEGVTDSLPLKMCRGDKPGLESTPDVRDHIQRYTMAMIHLMDQAVGNIINKLKTTGRWDNTVVLFTSDHGDFLGDHGLCYKDLFGCHSLLHIPCLIRIPGLGRAITMKEQTSNVDMLPTLAALAGIDAPQHVHGSDIFSRSGDDPAFAYTFHSQDQTLHNFTAYDERYRLTCYPGLDYVEMFDHLHDPGEVRNIAGDPAHADRRSRLIAALQKANMKHNSPITGRIACF